MEIKDYIDNNIFVLKNSCERLKSVLDQTCKCPRFPFKLQQKENEEKDKFKQTSDW